MEEETKRAEDGTANFTGFVPGFDHPYMLNDFNSRYTILNRLIMRDLNNLRDTPAFSLYTKSDIAKYLANPYRYSKQLRRAVVYLYGASSHFRRLIQYFVGLSDLAYIIEPYKTDPKKTNVKTANNNYRKVLHILESMNIKTQLPKILTVCLREDVFYGTFWVNDESITIQQLPSDYCDISTIEGNVANVSFDFSYFNSRKSMLDHFPPEFRIKYETVYSRNRKNRWIELDSPTSFAVKCNTDIMEYPISPFAGILREIYDIEDYKALKLTKEALENYAMIAMKIPIDEEGKWLIDEKKARSFWSNLAAVLPEELATVLTPMELQKISFERTHNGDTNAVSDAEQNLFTAAGVSSLLFNNEKASANALLLSIKADQVITYGIVKSIGDVINRLLHSFPYGRNWIVNFLDVSPYNRKEVGDAYLKAATYGLPTISAYAASQGIGQAELDSMSFLEGTVLELPKMFKPIRSSTQMSSDELDSDSSPGAPEKDASELTDSGEQSAEQKDDWG